ncbi:CAP domain-containing protein [Granulosicoccus sp.]|nr:CAP domain-containing protein [Granulosicoccus sp.]MDB4224078.1 CAP domain-containing protein [Granulosicoccus sp.]
MIIIITALLLNACSANNPVSSDKLTTGPSTASSIVPQANVDQALTPTIDENTAPIAPEQSGETDSATPPIGAATPTDIATTVDILAPDAIVECSASGLHIQLRTLELINEARSQPRACGTVSFEATDDLSWNTLLLQAADKHSTDMAQHNFFDHIGSDGSTIGARVDETGYEWRAVGENIAAGQETASSAIAGWLDSPGHCRNIMNPAFTEIAVSCAEDAGADFSQYWTNVLATAR